LPTLDQRNHPVAPNIHINFSSAAPLGAEATRKLVTSVTNAERMVQGALDRLNRAATITGIYEQAFRFHLKAGPDNGDVLRRVILNLSRVHTGLAAPLVLSDQRAAEIKKFLVDYKKDIEESCGKSYGDGASLIRDLVSDNGWGSNVSFFQTCKRTYYRQMLAHKYLGRYFSVIGDAAGSVNITGSKQFFESRDKRQRGLNADYTWIVAEGLDEHIRKVNNIHLDFSMFESSTMPVSSSLFHACVLTHEATHRFALTADFAYTDDPDYGSLTTAQSVNNADSLAYLCVCFHKAALIKEAIDIKSEV